VEQWQWQKPGDEDAAQSYIISTGSDKQVHLFNTKEGNAVVSSLSNLSDSPVLSFVTILQGRYCLMTNMSGKLILQYQSQTLDSRKDHKKYAVKVVAHQDRTDQSKWWVATAGWDEMVILYCLNIPEGDASTLKIGEPFARIKIESNPQSLLFVPHVDTNELSLLVSREDSPQIYYYEVKATNEPDSEGDGDGEPVMSPRGAPLVGQQSLAPRSNSWGAFSPAHMVLSPHDPSLLAVATTSSLHLKVMIVRLLFPRDPPKVELDFSAQISQAADVMELLSITNREDAAILVQANTFAPQTAYSTPQLAWRPDGSGVWVNGDDGVVRGIETKTGKVVALLKGGHVEDCKVRTVWSGYVTVPQEGGDLVREEWVISGGFDKRLIIWKV
jgi:WD40 repeat protein